MLDDVDIALASPATGSQTGRWGTEGSQGSDDNRSVATMSDASTQCFGRDISNALKDDPWALRLQACISSLNASCRFPQNVVGFSAQNSEGTKNFIHFRSGG